MAAQHLDTDNNAALRNILADSELLISQAQNLYLLGEAGPRERIALHAQHTILGQMLAHFEDGPGYGKIAAHVVGAMRDYETIACSLGDAIDAEIRGRRAVSSSIGARP